MRQNNHLRSSGFSGKFGYMTISIILIMLIRTITLINADEIGFSSDYKKIKIELTTSLTMLFSFQKNMNGVYEFQGPPPGIYVLISGSDVIFKNDYFKYDPSIYYAGIGYITDQTLQYGHRFILRTVEIVPTVGLGVNFGYINDYILHLYIPVSLIIKLFDNDKFNISLWGQVQNYFLTENGPTYWLGGKVAIDVNFKLDENIGLSFQPIIGGGGSQLLFGLRAGCIFSLK